MDWNNKNIGFAMTGSFCTFAKVIAELEHLKKTGANLLPIFSQNTQTTDTRFGKADDFIKQVETITGNRIIRNIAEAEPIGPKKLIDALVIAPCTGNTLAKLANGITDTCVTMAAKSTIRNHRPVLIAISTNDGLGTSAKNIGQLLNMKNFYFVPFSQDDPIGKNNSLVADMSKIKDSLECALSGIQIQPLLQG